MPESLSPLLANCPDKPHLASAYLKGVSVALDMHAEPIDVLRLEYDRLSRHVMTVMRDAHE